MRIHEPSPEPAKSAHRPESRPGRAATPSLIELQQAFGNRAVSRLVGKSGPHPASRMLRIQRRIDLDFFEDHLARSKPVSTTLAGFLKTAEWRLLSESVEEHNRRLSHLTLQMIATAVERIDSVVIADFIDAFSNLLDQVSEEAGRLFLNNRRAAVPTGVNDATDLKASMNNCAAIVAGVMTGKRSSEVSKNVLPSMANDFFTEYYLSKEKRQPSNRFEGRGAINKDQVQGVRLWVSTTLKKAGIKIGSVEERGQAAPDDLSLETAISQMQGYPTGTQFAVGLAIADPRGPSAAHWVYADNYGGRVTFFDYQRDRLYPLVRTRETESYAKTMAQLAEKEKASEDKGMRPLLEQVGNIPMIDTTKRTSTKPKGLESPVIYDYSRDQIDPPALEPNGVLYLAFRPSFNEVERLRRKLLIWD